MPAPDLSSTKATMSGTDPQMLVICPLYSVCAAHEIARGEEGNSRMRKQSLIIIRVHIRDGPDCDHRSLSRPPPHPAA